MSTLNIKFVGPMNPEQLTGERVDYVYNGTLYVGSIAAKVLVNDPSDLDDIPEGFYAPGTKAIDASGEQVGIVGVDGTWSVADDDLQ